MISVSVKIHHGFRKLLPRGMTGNSLEMLLESGTTVETLLRHRVGFPMDVPKVILVNGLHAEEGQQLKDGDRVSLFAPMAGG